jgi:NAD(P)-dependent dehydrogenase (short-subunit alcohol dehydrogenase family)
MSKPVCLVTVGPDQGTGAAIAERFANGGDRAGMLSRSLGAEP